MAIFNLLIKKVDKSIPIENCLSDYDIAEIAIQNLGFPADELLYISSKMALEKALIGLERPCDINAEEVSVGKVHLSNLSSNNSLEPYTKVQTPFKEQHTYGISVDKLEEVPPGITSLPELSSRI
ncbi:unnamed protein product [Lepeophtheirus salmonis]|uniref:(salmon louse) hypothetical protein n=1 Tax=Lepeophtheirus salmonis TaxID=72036 RepID=A0A7R8CFC0_LEPSM|nr:unnamed protein product [Lepeophtheirus salmonis]CAF2750380.1 unnamed protein product [Lepeophtheirus salmonis]